MGKQPSTESVPGEPSQAIAFDSAFYFLGPASPDPTFEDTASLAKWYRSTVDCWKKDCFSMAAALDFDSDTARGPQAFFNEAFKTGIRQLNWDLLRNLHIPSVSSRALLRRWCDFFRTVAEDDERLVTDRSLILLTPTRIPQEIRDAEGVAELLLAADREAALRGWRSAIRLEDETDHSHHVAFMPDDPRLLILWNALAIAGKRAGNSLPTFVDSEPAHYVSPRALLDHVVPLIWRLMRQLGEPCVHEPTAPTSLSDVRNALGQAVCWCDQPTNPNNPTNQQKPKSVNTPRRTATPNGPALPRMIERDAMYALDEAKFRCGWNEHAFRQARRGGLKVLYVGRTAFVMGDELIRYIQEHGVR